MNSYSVSPDNAPGIDTSKTYQPLREWLSLINEDYEAFVECCEVWDTFAAVVKSMAAETSVESSGDQQQLRCVVRPVGLFDNPDRFRALTRLLVAWCDNYTTTINAEPLDDTARFLLQLDDPNAIRQQISAATLEAYDKARAVLERMVVVVALRKGESIRSEELLTIGQMAELVREAQSTLEKRKGKPLPFVKNRGTIPARYRWCDVKPWLYLINPTVIQEIHSYESAMERLS